MDGLDDSKPSIGRIVHYTNLGSVDDDGNMLYPPTQQAAIITGVHGNSWAADLLVFYKTGQFHMEEVLFSKTYRRGCWSWPERV